jgi:hypothetical protein
MTAVNLWRGHEGGRRALRILSGIVIAGALIAPTLTLIFGNLDSASNVAQLVSVPVGLLGLSGTLLTVPRRDGLGEGAAAIEAAQANSPASRGISSASERPEALAKASVVLGTVSLVAALISVLVVLNPTAATSRPMPSTTAQVPDTSDYGDTRQKLIVVDGAAPVSFEGGDLWKWIDPPEGETVVEFSPGGGAKNDGLRALSGEIYQAGRCGQNSVFGRFTADGHRVYMDSPGMARLTLPDHVDKLVLTIVAHYPKNSTARAACRLVLSWRDPGVLRKGPVPKG